MTDVRFYRANERPYGAFSNLARYPVELEGETFFSAEAAYQAAKPRDPKVREWLLAAPTPALLAKVAHQLTRAWEVAPGWSRNRYDRMRKVLYAKFTQNTVPRELLLATGDARIIENGTIDDDAGRRWGCVHVPPLNGCNCKNMLGQMLMELREQLRAEMKPAVAPATALTRGGGA